MRPYNIHVDTPSPPGTGPTTPQVAGNVVLYRIDAGDRIVEVGGAWEIFAADNDGQAVAAAKVLGRPLWDFITGPSTVLVWRQILDHVRQIGTTVRFSFRCDSPRLRRYMRMAVSPRPRQSVLFHSQLFRTEPRPVPVRATARPDDPAVIKRCSLCNFFQVRGMWTDVVDAVEIGLVMDHDMPVVVAYGICPHCRNLLAQAANDSLRTDAGPETFTSVLRSPPRDGGTAAETGPDHEI